MAGVFLWIKPHNELLISQIQTFNNYIAFIELFVTKFIAFMT